MAAGACGDDGGNAKDDAGVGADAAIDGPVDADQTPMVPTITATTPATTSAMPSQDRTPVVTGTTTTTATVTIYTTAGCGGAPVGTGTTDASGTFAITLTSDLVADGTTALHARASISGSTSACSPIAFNYYTDNTAPLPPNLSSTTPGTNASVPARSRLPTVVGATNVGGLTVTIHSSSTCNAPLGSGTSDSNGNFSFPLTTMVAADGLTTLYATTTDAAGNVSACTSSGLNYYTDNTAPTPPTITAASPVTTPSAPRQNRLPTIDGTADAGTTIRIYTAAGCVNGLVGTGGAGGGTFTVSLTTMLGPDGEQTLYVSSTDVAGNASCSSASFSYYTDNTGPTVVNVTASNADNTHYTNPTVIGVRVQFSEPVTVINFPRVLLETGATDRYATYASGSGTSTLTFNYTIVDGDSAADLNYVATTSLEINGGSLSDGAGNSATVTLPAPTDATSLGGTMNITVDTAEPVISAFAVTPTVFDATTALLGLNLTWTVADDHTAANMLAPTICRSLAPATCATSFTATFVPSLGATSAPITSGVPNTRYWFVLRITDRAGNITLVDETHVGAGNVSYTSGVYGRTPSDKVSIEVVAGAAHNCALTGHGRVYCWGDNTYGQTGQGYLGNSPVVAIPREVPLPDPAIELVAGNNHTCARTDRHHVYCWGDNQYGQLGAGDFTNRHTPAAQAPTVRTFHKLVAGGNHTCALTLSNLFCWGRNHAYQLGDTTQTDRASAVSNTIIPAVTPLRDVAGGDDFTCVLEAGGTIKCFGDNSQGQLGNSGVAPNPIHSYVDAPLVAGDSAIALGAGSQHVCAFLASRRITCWGRNNAGQLGNGGTTNATAPSSGISAQFTKMPHRFGAASTCAIATDRRQLCWGANASGAFAQPANPILVPSTTVQTNVISTAIGNDHVCYVTVTGGVTCHGSNANGLHGDNNSTQTGTNPAAAYGPYGAPTPKQIALGHYHTCALYTDGDVYCWGANNRLQLGAPLSGPVNYPQRVTSVTGASQIAAGQDHTCVIGSFNTISCWGANGDGQLGDTTTTDSATANPIVGFGGTSQLALAGNHSCAIFIDQPACWGDNIQRLQGGSDTTADATSPIPVGFRDGVQTNYESTLQIAVSETHACLLHGNPARYGDLSCWGDNGFGQHGLGTSGADVPFPSITTFAQTDVRQVSCGRANTCTIDGTTGYCWGSDSEGQLADGATNPGAAIVLVQPLASFIRSGYHRMFARAISGDLNAAGDNDTGELGLGFTGDRDTLQLMPGVRPRDVASAIRHSCFLYPTGVVECAGYNGGSFDSSLGAGRLGTGDWDDTPTRTPVIWL